MTGMRGGASCGASSLGSSYEGASSDARKIASRRATELQIGMAGFNPPVGGNASSADAMLAWPALPPSPVTRGASMGASPVSGFSLGGWGVTPVRAGSMGGREDAAVYPENQE